MPKRKQEFFTFNSKGDEVPADEFGNALDPEIPGAESLVEEYEKPSEEISAPPKTKIIEEMPKDIPAECLVLETDTGWVTFNPEHIQDEEKVLILLLNGSASGFIPRMGSRFTCHMRKVDGAVITQQLYYAGFRFSLPQLPDKTILGFVKT